MGPRQQAPDKKWGLYLLGGGILSAVLFGVVLAVASSALRGPSETTEVDSSATAQLIGQASSTVFSPQVTESPIFSPTPPPEPTGDTPAPSETVEVEATTTLPPTSSPGENSTPTQAPVSGSTPTPSRTPPIGNTTGPTRTPTRTAAPQQIKAGTYLVGSQISPGIYLGVPKGEDSCYWQRLSNLSGNFEAIITDGYSVGQFYVQIFATDFAFSTDCDVIALSSLPQPDDVFAQTFAPGMYLVKRDIAPGVYRGEGVCYWERLSDVAGTIDSIIANANPMGQFYLRIKDSDFAVSIDCEIVSLAIVPVPSGTFPLSIEPGVYLVGRDILPGFYSGQGPYCYWERLSDVTGEDNAIISRDNPQGAFTVRVFESDYAFSTECDLQRTGN